MRKFLLIILLTFGLPLLLLLGIFLYTDPFCSLGEFDLDNVDVINREYLSMELFLRNKEHYHYDSFVFASSRGGGINTYTWKRFLPEGSQPYLFQAWSETLTGVQLKMQYIHEQNIPIRNALLLIDIPSTFANKQLPSESLSLKHYLFTGQPRWVYNGIHFFNFIQSPSLWIKSMKRTIHHTQYAFASDTITNDYDVNNGVDYAVLPEQDSMRLCSDMTRRTFLAKIAHKSDEDIQMSPQLIDDTFLAQLYDIKSIFDKNNTDYHIIITPGFCYTSEYINSIDMSILIEIFGADRVHDYSSPNELNCDYNNFSDPNHFGLRVGYIMLKEIYEDTIIQ